MGRGRCGVSDGLRLAVSRTRRSRELHHATCGEFHEMMRRSVYTESSVQLSWLGIRRWLFRHMVVFTV